MQNQSHWTNVKVQAALIPSGGSRRESVFSLFFFFPRMDVVLTPWLVAPHHKAFSLSASIVTSATLGVVHSSLL